MKQVYISLDLETTGLNPEVDDIIEIGAVRFNEGQVVDTFHSLVNPQHPLPYRVQVLCGISQHEVDAAPMFSELAEALSSFLENSPIVGHNISFDLSFLAQKGIKLNNTTYDTHELATLFLFQQSDYSLSSLAKQLGLSTPQHRALSDAMAAKDLFVALLDRAHQLDLATLEELVRLADKSRWELAHLFREILKSKAKMAFTAGGRPATKSIESKVTLWKEDGEQPLSARPERTPLDIQKMSTILEPGGTLSRALPGYEHRPGQIRMMQTIAEALNNSEHLIVEAGTGTGKSIAYLLPAIFFALENSVPVVISTNTINLQEQLISKDIPDLLRALQLQQNHEGENLRAVQLKGRSNYLCLKRYEALRESDRLTLDEAKLLARIRVWLLSTQSGDRAELKLSGGEFSTWNKLCAQFEERLEAQCPHRQRSTCFLYRARQAAENAHLIVTNHALLLSDLVADAMILPPYRHLVIDEAHHLENEATNQLGSQVTQWDLFDYLNRFRRETGEQRRSGLLALLDDCFRSSTAALSKQRQIKQLTEALSKRVEKAQQLVLHFFNTLRDFIKNHASDQGEYEQYFRLTSGVRAQSGWSRVEIVWEDLNLVLRDIAEELDRLHLELLDLADNNISGYDYLMLEIPSLFYRTNELRQQIDSLVSHREADSIYWLTLNRQTDAVNLYTAPLSTSNVLEKSIFSPKDCVILTGATLSSEGTFEYIKGRLGLEFVNELLLEAPFDYLTSTMVYMPNDIPNPGGAGYQQAVQTVLLDLCRTLRGRTLVLFTSRAALRTTLAAIQAPLEEEGILVLGQGVDGSPKQLLATFKSNPETVLLGTASLWEGIDVVGDALSVLVIAKLPFNVPTEPVFAARSEMFDDPFNQYTIPQATIRFKQGFGRLIRSKTDRGVMVILDRRLQSKKYGSAFLDSIPLCTVVRGSAQDLPAAAQGWLDREKGSCPEGRGSSACFQK